MKELAIGDEVLNAHTQIEGNSCVPMSVEFVLKLLGRMDLTIYPFQKDLNKHGNSDWANGFIFNKVKFTRLFNQPRDNQFPLKALFDKISYEINSGRYVIVTLEVGRDERGTLWHNYVINKILDNGEFGAITKYSENDKITDVSKRIEVMQGTDIIIYTLLDE